MTGLLNIWLDRPGGPTWAKMRVAEAVETAIAEGCMNFHVVARTAFDGMPEITTMGNSSRRFVPGPKSVTITVRAT